MRVLYTVGPDWQDKDLISARLLQLPKRTNIVLVDYRMHPRVAVSKFNPDVVWVFSDDIVADHTDKLLDAAAEKLIPGVHILTNGEVRYGW